MASSSQQWQSLGDVSYQKFAVYDMKWNVTATELEYCGGFASGRFGGVLALLPNEQEKNRNGVLYSMCGEMLGQVPLKQPIHQIVEGGIGWLDFAEGRGAELLVVVYMDGYVDAVTASGAPPSSSMKGGLLNGNVLKNIRGTDDEIIVHACVFGEGIACVLNNGKVVLYYAKERKAKVFNNGSPIFDARTKSELRKVLCMDVSSINNVFVAIIALADGHVYRVTLDDCTKHVVAISDKEKQGGVVLKMCVAPNGRFIACFNANGWLTVTNTGFTKTVLEFDTKAGVEPLQMCWCGEDSVVMQWKQLGLLMVGPYGDWIKYTYNQPVVIIQEIDCLRIISQDQMEILQRIHPSTESIGRIGSFSPAAMLCDAIDALDAGDAKADVTLRAIKEEESLVEAVKECILAACNEFDVKRQQQLLRAASIGKTFCDTDSERRDCASAFLLACNALRTLNVVRHSSVGLPLTIQQYEVLGPSRLIARLAARRFHLLALKLCTYLGLEPTEKQSVLMDWAMAKLRAPLKLEGLTRNNSGDSPTKRPLSMPANKYQPSSVGDVHSRQYANPVSTIAGALPRPPPLSSADETTVRNRTGSLESAYSGGNPAFSDEEEIQRQLFEVLQNRLSPVRGIRYARLSRVAFAAGKKTCSSLLAHSEPVSLHRILQLLRIGESSKALAYAVHSHDPNLILFSVLYLWPSFESPLTYGTSRVKSGGIRELGDQLKEKAAFFTIVTQYPIAREVLVKYCEAVKDWATLRELYQHITKMHKAGSLTVTEAYQMDSLEKRNEKLGVAVEHYQQSRNSQFYAQITADQMKLLRIQKELEELTGKACFVDNSLADTIFNCLILQLDKKALQLKDEFKASERMFHYIKVKALAQLQDWPKLHALASQKRLPISILAFVEACLEAEDLEQARQFAYLIKDDKEKLEAYIKTKSWENAVNLAAALKDIPSLQLIRNNCNDEEIIASIISKVRSIG